MRRVDVDVLVYAHRSESPDHDPYAAWLDDARVGDEPSGLSDVVLAGFLRVVSHPGVFKEPTPLASALAFVHARGNLVPDAYWRPWRWNGGRPGGQPIGVSPVFHDLEWRHPLEAG